MRGQMARCLQLMPLEIQAQSTEGSRYVLMPRILGLGHRRQLLYPSLKYVSKHNDTEELGIEGPLP